MGQRNVFPSRYANADIEDRDQLRRYFDKRYEIKTGEANKYAHIPSVWGDEPASPPMNPALKPFVGKFTKWCTSTDWSRQDENSRRAAVSYVAGAFGYHCYADAQFPQVAAAIEAAYAKQQLPVVTVSFDLETGVIGRVDQLLSEISTTLNQPEDPMNAPQVLTVETRAFVNGVDVATLSNNSIFELIAQQEKAIEKLNEIKAKPKKLTDEIVKRQAGIAALVAHLDKAA